MRSEEPFEGAADDVVVVVGAQRQPAGGLGGVDEGAGAVRGGRGADRREVGDGAVGRLDRADGDERRAGPHRAGQLRQRDRAERQVPAARERVHQGTEVAVGDEYFGARRQPRGDLADARGDGRADGDTVDGSGQPAGRRRRGRRRRRLRTGRGAAARPPSRRRRSGRLRPFGWVAGPWWRCWVRRVRRGADAPPPGAVLGSRSGPLPLSVPSAFSAEFMTQEPAAPRPQSPLPITAKYLQVSLMLRA